MSDQALFTYNERGEKPAGQEPEIEIYEGWEELPKDAQLMNIYHGPREGVTCYGVYTRTYDMTFTYNNGSPGHLQICREGDQVMGYRFRHKEAQMFAHMLRPQMDNIWNSQSAVGSEDGKYIALVDIVDICG